MGIIKYLVILLFMPAAIADQRFETVGEFCHFVTPEGFATANHNNEVFASGCQSSIRQNADATGSGSTIHTIKYPPGALPFVGEYAFSGAVIGSNCAMVDSDGTTYATQDWDAIYKVYVEDLEAFREAFGSSDPDYDYNDDGFVNYLDMTVFKQNMQGEIEYTLICRNGSQL